MHCDRQNVPVRISLAWNGLAGRRRFMLLAGGFLVAAVGCWPATTYAQSTPHGRYFPLDQTVPPGTAGRWAGVQRGFAPVMQPVRVELPEGGQVAYYSSPAGDHADMAAASVVALQVGSVYRLKISEMPGFTGAELYPTVELIDRLHPPRGREIEFPIPIVLTVEEISQALDGRLVTKVIYLEQPDRADPVRRTDKARSQIARPRDNVLALADEAGRPMAIVRLGGRAPDSGAVDSGFFGTGAPIQVLQQAANAPQVMTP